MTRLHPLSVPYRVAQAVLGYVPLVIFIAFPSGSAFGGIGLAIAVLATVVGFGAVVAWQLAYYRRFDYETTPDTFDIRSGVLSRRHREIPYRRVQNVDISRNVVQRALDIAELRIETAGGGETEAVLRYVGYEEAKRLQDELRRRKRAEHSTEGGTQASDEEDLLYAITPEDLAVLAVASFDLRLASFLSVLLSFAGPPVLLELLTDLPVSPFLVVGAVVVLVVIASALLSGAGAVLGTYGFRLTRSGEELRYERGLIQRFDGSIPLDKVQSLVVRENLLKRLLGYASLAVETAGYAPGQDGGVGSESAVPIADRGTVRTIAREIEPFEEPTFVRPPKRARRRYAVRYLLALGVLAGLVYAGTLVLGFEMYWYALLLGLPLAPVAAHYKWASRGYCLGADHVLTRTGFWNRTTRIVPYYRVQNAIHTQTVLQRRWRLASVVIDTAGTSSLVGGDARALDLDETAATELREAVAERLQTTLRNRRRGAVGGARDRRIDRALPRFEAT
ncbi:PH domain-containing protein [Halalkalicoccus jeotgali]|uniref:Membrane-flanked domain protein n=1 Tax=Halalkalicoccus jeotgali (strain DSM 18796 / CECT 7217 / JCM 14584 / KCTC 4019 / B3) TaxID=795797 RepID=D8J3Y5_HALJB|nr:PH domain-containing protein [Halalkalicoccus jeotgali]ADJ15377.1 membrane-flanked domain protein [Halalkalicoccus jeotgali B3]ELY35410.1 membrane-flanked domain-containing protein [Halalkalicoccus jeotgali B3]